jgi:phasin family protein
MHNNRIVSEPRLMSEPRPRFFDFDAAKMFAEFPFRPLDVEAVWAAQRRNLDALSQAHQVAVDGVQALARRNVEAARQSLEDFSVLMRDLAKPVSAEERITRHTEFAKRIIEKGVSHSREVTQMVAKTGSEAAEILHKRASEGLDEIRAYAAPKA